MEEGDAEKLAVSVVVEVRVMDGVRDVVGVGETVRVVEGVGVALGPGTQPVAFAPRT